MTSSTPTTPAPHAGPRAARATRARPPRRGQDARAGATLGPTDALTPTEAPGSTSAPASPPDQAPAAPHAAAGPETQPQQPEPEPKPEPAGGVAPPAPAARVTKAAQLQALLAAPGGATLARLGAALGWQSHTVRAALTRLRQAGHMVERSRTEDGQTLYRIGPGGSVEVGAVEAVVVDQGSPAATAAAPADEAPNAPDADAPKVASAVSGGTEFPTSEAPAEVAFAPERTAAAPLPPAQDGEVA